MGAVRAVREIGCAAGRSLTSRCRAGDKARRRRSTRGHQGRARRDDELVERGLGGGIAQDGEDARASSLNAEIECRIVVDGAGAGDAEEDHVVQRRRQAEVIWPRQQSTESNSRDSARSPSAGNSPIATPFPFSVSSVAPPSGRDWPQSARISLFGSAVASHLSGVFFRETPCPASPGRIRILQPLREGANP